MPRYFFQYSRLITRWLRTPRAMNSAACLRRLLVGEAELIAAREYFYGAVPAIRPSAIRTERYISIL